MGPVQSNPLGVMKEIFFYYFCTINKINCVNFGFYFILLNFYCFFTLYVICQSSSTCIKIQNWFTLKNNKITDGVSDQKKLGGPIQHISGASNVLPSLLKGTCLVSGCSSWIFVCVLGGSKALSICYLRVESDSRFVFEFERQCLGFFRRFVWFLIKYPDLSLTAFVQNLNISTCFHCNFLSVFP